MALVAASAAIADQAVPTVAPGATPSGTWNLLPAPRTRPSPYDRLFVAPERDASRRARPARFAPVTPVTPVAPLAPERFAQPPARFAPVPPVTLVTPQVTPRATPSSATARSAPKVVCGLTVVPGDPNVDRGIAATMPDASTRFTMRSVEPALCR